MSQKASTQEVLSALAKAREQDVDGLEGAVFSIPGWVGSIEYNLDREVRPSKASDDCVWLVRALVTGIACLEQHGLPGYLKGD